MLTFVQFLEELAKKDVTVPFGEVKALVDRLGTKVLRMGSLQEDSSLLIPVDSILEAAQAVGSRKLAEAVETLRSEQVVSMLQSVDTLVERVAEARKRKLGQMVDRFQAERDDSRADQQWKEIEKMVFGVDFHD